MSLMKFKNDLKKKMEKSLQKTAEEVAYKIEEAYEASIEEFYSSYDPNFYDRSSSLFLASDGYSNTASTIHSNGNSSYMVGIHVGSETMGSPYRADADWVLSRAFLQGIHGIYEPYFAGAVYGQFKSKYVGYGTDLGSYTIPPITTPPASLMESKFQNVVSQIPSIFEANLG